ncbi:MAG: hypothetical protein ACRDY2_03600 [Acidimicrobiales bacterium]
MAYAQPGLYIADRSGVQLVSPTGTISTLIRSGSGTIMIGNQATSFFPDAITIGANGNLYVSDFSPKLLIEFSPAGRVLSTWTAYISPAGLSTAPNGTILVANYGTFAVDRLSGGYLVPVATFHRGTFPSLAGVFRPSGVTAMVNGDIYADTDGVSGGTNRGAVTLITSGDQASMLST